MRKGGNQSGKSQIRQYLPNLGHLMTGQSPRQNRGSHQDPIGNLIRDQATGEGIEDCTIDFHPEVHWTRMHEPLIPVEAIGPFGGQSVGATVVRWNETALASFTLYSQHHEHVDIGKHLIKVVRNRSPPVGPDAFEALINHAGRTDQRDVRSH